MTTSSIFAVSAAGMDVERLRADIATLNLANANIPWPATDGVGYRPLQVVVSSGGFDAKLQQWAGLPEARVTPLDQAPREVLEPGHPMANGQGVVRYPAVDQTTEMLHLMHAMRAYEANVAAFNMSRTMAMKALDIGGAT